MDCLNLVLDQLENQGINPVVDEFNVSWLDYSKNEHYISLTNIDCTDEKIAWFQSSDNDEHLLQTVANGEAFKWEPITYNPYFGCTCYLIEWVQDYLIFIYKEKHDTYICSVQGNTVNTFNFHGAKLTRLGDVLLFEKYGEETEDIRRIRIPDLTILDSISRDLAQKDGLLPQLPFNSKDLRKK